MQIAASGDTLASEQRVPGEQQWHIPSHWEQKEPSSLTKKKRGSDGEQTLAQERLAS